MRLTLEDKYGSVTISVQADELSVAGVVERLVRPALLGKGYMDKSIDTLIGPIDDKGIMEGTSDDW